MKKIIFMVMVCFMAMFATNANAEVNYGMYITPKLSYTFYTGDYIEKPMSNSAIQSGTSSFGGGVALGYDFYEFLDIPLRTELEYMMRSDAQFDVEGDTMKVQCPKTLFTNAYLDYQNSTDFTPYVGGGVGMAFVEDRVNFAWNVGTGVQYAFSENVNLDLGVRYVDFGSHNPDHYSLDMSGIEATCGLGYTF